LPFLLGIAGDVDLLGATALRMGMSAALLVLSVPFWLRRRLTSGGARLGLLPPAPWSVSLARGLLLAGGIGVIVAVGVAGVLAAPATSTVSVAIPLGLACLALIGHALRERSSGLLLVAGLLVSLTAGLTTWQFSLVQSAELRWVSVAQACLVAGA